MWMPGTLVATGLNSPRILSGAAGFMSQVSSWLGPPCRRNRTQERAVALLREASAAHSRPGSDRPKAPSPPRRSHSRRLQAESRDISNLPSSFPHTLSLLVMGRLESEEDL